MSDSTEQSLWQRFKTRLSSELDKPDEELTPAKWWTLLIASAALIISGFAIVKSKFPNMAFVPPGSMMQAAMQDVSSIRAEMMIWNLFWMGVTTVVALGVLTFVSQRLRRIPLSLRRERFNLLMGVGIGMLIMLPFAYLADSAGMAHGSDMSARTTEIAAKVVPEVLASDAEYDQAAFLSLMYSLVGTDVYGIKAFEEVPDTYDGWIEHRKAKATAGAN